MRTPAAIWTRIGAPAAGKNMASSPTAPVAGSDFETLVLAQQAYVARLAHRLLAWNDDAADVVQDVFLAAYRHWPGFRRDAKVTTWLTSITVNVCRSHRRRSRLRFRWLTRNSSAVDAESAKAPDLDASGEQHDAVRSAVKALPTRYREAIVLRYLEGFAIDEIGVILGRSRATIDAQLSRGRALLRDSLARWMED
jgi:RNA polymerase sigma-70 factor (ECF subfamily)